MPARKKLVRYEQTIIEAYVQHDRTYQELAAFYNVAVGTIRNILRRNNVQPRRAGRRRNDGVDLEQYKEENKKAV